MDFVAIDFETANPKRNSACSIGLAIVERGVIVDTTASLIRPPELDFHPINSRIHGIKKEDVVDQPTFDQVWELLGSILKKKTIIAHNAAFDISVLKQSLDYYELPYPKLNYICTMKFSKIVWPNLPDYKLKHLAKRIGFAFKHHDPREDAAACASIAIECCREKKANSLNELAKRTGLALGFLGYDEDQECLPLKELPSNENQTAIGAEIEVNEISEPESGNFAEIKKKANQLLKEAAFREEDSPLRAVELYQEAIRLFYKAGQMTNEKKIRPISFPLNRLTLTLERHGDLRKCLFQIDLYEPCLQDDDIYTGYIKKRKERVGKKLFA